MHSSKTKQISFFSRSLSSTASSSGASSICLNSSPVEEWWKDLHVWCEPECMTYLQSKPLDKHQSDSKTSLPTSEIELFDSNRLVEETRRIRKSASGVEISVEELNKHLAVDEIPSSLIQTIMSQVQEFIFDFNGSSSASGSAGWNFPGLRTANRIDDQRKSGEILLLQQKTLMQIVDRLRLFAHRSQYSPRQQQPSNLIKIIAALERAFEKLVDMTLAKELRSVTLELKSKSEMRLRSALSAVILLGNEGWSRLCAALSKESCIKFLVVNAKSGSPEVKILALRALSSVCCVSEAIREFENCNGLKVIDHLLSSSSTSTEERVESAGVLAQITSPWIVDNHKIADLDSHVQNLVASLTNLARLPGGRFEADETFLLVTAALANLTFMSPLTSAAMKRANTVKALVKAVKSSPCTSLFAKDQVVTVLANMAANANCRPDIRAVDGVAFLIAMLETKAKGLGSSAELAAAERVQKKSAIALSRLCNDTQVCYDVIRSGGADRLVELCRDAGERNHSDAVLVAALAVLRRLKNNLDTEDFSLVFYDQLEAADLVRPKLVDSFLEYSTSKHESYV